MSSQLQAVAQSAGARRILEIGTGDGTTTMQLAAALPPDGMLITMAADSGVAAKARQHVAAAGLSDRVSVIAGETSRFLHKVAGPFDVIFENGASGAARDRLLALLRAGGVLITSNTKYSEGEGDHAALSIQVKT